MINLEYRTCPSCGNTKPIEDYRIGEATGIRYLNCWDCVERDINKREPQLRRADRCPTCKIAVPILRFYDEHGIKHKNCLACRVVGPTEINKDFNESGDERAARYIKALEDSVKRKKKLKRSMYDN
jgi:Zn ribbon nucleic-acid-binding protein